MDKRIKFFLINPKTKSRSEIAILKPFLFSLDPETAHDLAIKSLKFNYLPEKIFKTGSPRIDLWRPSISEYWDTPKSIPEKPFLLVSSNLASIFERISLKERIGIMKKGGYFDR